MSHPGGGARQRRFAQGAINITTLHYSLEGLRGWGGVLGRGGAHPGKQNKVRIQSLSSGVSAPDEGGGGAKQEREKMNLVSRLISPKFSLRLPEKMPMKDRLCGPSVFFGQLPGGLDRKPRSSHQLHPYGNTFCSILTPPGGDRDS